MSLVVPKIIKSILLVDDDPDSLEMYSNLLEKTFKGKVHSSRYPTQAISAANKHLFDIIIIDVTIDYLGSTFGGLDLYKQFLSRYGNTSLLAYSQYITDDLLKSYNYNFNFIEKCKNSVAFCDKIGKKITKLRKEQTCFVAMPFDDKYNKIFATIKKCVQESSYKCVRVDQQLFTKSIIEKVYEEISESKIIIFLATDKNPNAYFECGYAIALEKEVITITDNYSNLPFDIRDRNAIEYGTSLNKLKKELKYRLDNLTKNN